MKRYKTICFIGAGDGVGKRTVSMNLAMELVHRSQKIVYGASFDVENPCASLLDQRLENNGDARDDMVLLDTKIDGLKCFSFSEKAPQMTPQKMEELMVGLPDRIGESADYFIFNVKDPFSFPDRYILLQTDIYIIVARINPKVFSDIFQQLEKFAFSPVKPRHMYLLFNHTSDIYRAYETYLKIMKQADEFNINIKIYLLGIMPRDLLRQSLSAKLELPIRLAFPASACSGSIAFMAEKIMKCAEKAEE